MADRPYIFFELTNSLCSTCLRKVEAKVIFQEGRVYLVKHCPEHKQEKVLISTDVDYYQFSRRALKPGTMPRKFNTTIERGCPYDCGLCPDHEQHSCLALVEITDHCNLTCPICYAESSPRQAAASVAGADRVHARLRRAERRTPGHRADLRRRADDPSRVLRRARPRPGAADQASDGQHQRRADRAGPGIRPAARRVHAGLRGLPPVRLARRGAPAGVARRRPGRGPQPGARAPQRARDLDHAGRHAQEGAQRRPGRRDHRLRAGAALRARGDVPAGAGRRTDRGVRPGARPPDAGRGPRTNPRAVVRTSSPATSCRSPAIPIAWPWRMR